MRYLEKNNFYLFSSSVLVITQSFFKRYFIKNDSF